MNYKKFWIEINAELKEIFLLNLLKNRIWWLIQSLDKRKNFLYNSFACENYNLRIHINTTSLIAANIQVNHLLFFILIKLQKD